MFLSLFLWTVSLSASLQESVPSECAKGEGFSSDTVHCAGKKETASLLERRSQILQFSSCYYFGPIPY